MWRHIDVQVNFEILHCSDVFERRHKFLIHNALSCKHIVSIFFLPRKYDAISQLRHSYAKGPFCVTRLMSKMYMLNSYSKINMYCLDQQLFIY